MGAGVGDDPRTRFSVPFVDHRCIQVLPGQVAEIGCIPQWERATIALSQSVGVVVGGGRDTDDRSGEPCAHT